MTMPSVPIVQNFPIDDPVAVFAQLLATKLVQHGVIPSVEHVVYGPGAFDENDPPAPRVCLEIADDFTVMPPEAGETNPGPGLVVPMTQGGVQFDAHARSVYQIAEKMLMHLFARVPESGEEDPKDLMGRGPAIIAERAKRELRARVLAVLHDEFNLAIQSGGISGKHRNASESDGHYGAACTIVIPFYTQVPGSELLVKVSEQVPAEFEALAVTPTGDEFLAATVNVPAP